MPEAFGQPRQTWGSQIAFFWGKMSVKHKAQALVIQCIDFRFQELIARDIQNRQLTGKFDRIAYPGASKDLERVSQAAETSLKLHDPDEALIYEHEDCGAYGQDNSIETHRENAVRLKAFLVNIKPEIRVITLIATFEKIEEL
ncbi:hypothetical protein A2697_04190 [Candidatus Curtissbacteria bacterium RIFCSPHIGHO2_01_FULL_41_44]|uniref:Carbonic anhydrase n=1 Tax=Candidatus Curtissbacteria bacterium RIFCSPLOWO2_01_FULL_42_50 TaxID=1797730 RepID=A0A1F5H2Y1_9BACT|nr:MAG: hypothetical protein A3C33_04130 [Candidatus Curtissbacteria bacterium RIFCSPHIGHO2_02_FULL_42_58]OGD93763.1 MAG: hypothetical protein A2697_04190 [Candidatus Curtissbacteria bacterium RIFCSPHIGHO2_01_FULL_41_44]OGD97261.1 MAG: hypothetical protein A3E71_04340 [Candidatus Curtissbacteria bacterium RIFCSPHIGHO2_12_FULL_42_33]OGD98415.1 MAG: hypothetical protein A3B54_03710 [Candidatus Curtissbacteria bacterium RIFCSPLOWO2_01_FULL_42_50]OGE02332.1 MAG: hypothetical protein A3G16_03845 [Ca